MSRIDCITFQPNEKFVDQQFGTLFFEREDEDMLWFRCHDGFKMALEKGLVGMHLVDSVGFKEREVVRA